eukprot:11100292-Karenia_brevis.AAC.1
MFLDEAFKYRLAFSDDKFQCLPCLPDIDVFAPPVLELKIDKEGDHTHCKFSVMTGACPDMHVFHAPPPAFPSRHLILSVEPKSKNT